MLCELEISDDECYFDSLDVALLCEFEISDDECYFNTFDVALCYMSSIFQMMNAMLIHLMLHCVM